MTEKFDQLISDTYTQLVSEYGADKAGKGKPGDGRLSPEEETRVRGLAKEGDPTAMKAVAELDKKAKLAISDAVKAAKG
jgi:hypothetical protein